MPAWSIIICIKIERNGGHFNITYFSTRVCVCVDSVWTTYKWALWQITQRPLRSLSLQGNVIRTRTMEQYSNDVGNITHFCTSPPFKTRSIEAVTSCNSTQTLICKHIHIWIQVFGMLCWIAWLRIPNIFEETSRLHLNESRIFLHIYVTVAPQVSQHKILWLVIHNLILWTNSELSKMDILRASFLYIISTKFNSLT